MFKFIVLKGLLKGFEPTIWFVYIFPCGVIELLVRFALGKIKGWLYCKGFVIVGFWYWTGFGWFIGCTFTVALFVTILLLSAGFELPPAPPEGSKTL